VAIQLTPRRFNAAEYHQMIEAGVFGAEERLELIDGEVVEMSPIGDRHAACVRRLTAVLSRLFADQAIVDVQNPLAIDAAYVPQPDLVLLRPVPDFYASGTPTAADCLLIVEVGDSSAETDRQVKVPRYARGGVTDLWLVDLERGVVFVYRDPIGDTYQQVQVLRRGEHARPVAFPDVRVLVDSILG
jgi:Uma2 family endonuclease